MRDENVDCDQPKLLISLGATLALYLAQTSEKA